MKQSDILAKFPGETMPHFIAKAVLFYLLGKLKHDLRTEWRVPNGFVDIVDLTTQTIYEIEFDCSKAYRNRKIDLYHMAGFEVIVIDCHKLSTDINEMAVYLEQYIVPD